MSVSDSVLKRFHSRSLFWFYVAGISGFVIGLKLCDLILFRPQKYELMRQQMEDQYWKNHGQPTEIEPKVVACVANPLMLRKSWIQITYGKDKYIRKRDKDDMI